MGHIELTERLPLRPTPTPSPSVKTLADVITAVSESLDIREQQRREMKSAVRTMARCLGKDLAAISAEPGRLQKEIANLNHHKAGLTKGRWISVRSLTRKALQAAGIKLMPGRRRVSKFTAEWSALRVQCGPSHKMGLSRFMNHCSDAGIEPNTVDTAVFEDFRKELVSNSLVRDGEALYRETCRIWDRAGQTVEGWPTFRMGVSTKSRTYSRLWEEYPESLKRDVEIFLARGGNDDLLSDDNAPKLRDATITNCRRSLRLFSHALAESGIDTCHITALSVLVEPENARVILRFFLLRNNNKTSESIYGYASLLRIMARYYVHASPATLGKLDEYCKKLASSSKGMTKKNRERLRQFDDPETLHKFLRLPQKLMNLARSKDCDGEAGACLAMYALGIEILLHTALRIENLRNLSISKNLVFPSQPKGGRIIISIPPERVKNSQPIEHELPPALTALVREYIRDFRPRIAATPSEWLFPNEFGTQRSCAFEKQIAVLVLRHTGIIVNAHLFRHIAVKLYQSVNPHDLESMRQLLAHTNVATTARAYSEGNTSAANRQFTDLIENKRAAFEVNTPRKMERH